MLVRIRSSIDDRDEGFTLIELLVVIIIIGILAAIAIPVFLNQRKKGYQAGMKSDLRTVANAMESTFTDTQTYLGAPGFATSGAALTYGMSNSVGSDIVNLSNGDVVTLAAAGTSGFCLKVVNTTKTSGVTYFYDSTKGGLQPSTTTACSGTYS